MPASITSAALQKLEFFAGLPETLLWHLARSAEQRKLAAGEYLFRPGDERSVLAIILNGTISVDQERDGETAQLTQLVAGDVIGEGILLDEGTHGTAGRATEDTDLLCLRRDPLLKLLKDQPALYSALVGRAGKTISKRIKRANDTIAGFTSEFAGVRVHAERWVADVMALAPEIGYEQAMKVAQEALTSGRPVRDVARAKKLVK